MNVSIMFGLNLLLCRVCLMVLYSVSLSLSSSGYVVNLVVKYLMAAVHCSGGFTDIWLVRNTQRNNIVRTSFKFKDSRSQ